MALTRKIHRRMKIMYAKCIVDGGEKRRFVVSDFCANAHWMFSGKHGEQITRNEADLFWKRY